jgi:hypothetical protein
LNHSQNFFCSRTCTCQAVSLMLTRREKYLYIATMSYDEIDIEDMEWREEILAFTYQCPCGDLFQISMVNYR